MQICFGFRAATGVDLRRPLWEKFISALGERCFERLRLMSFLGEQRDRQ
jgi:hypothetical protein